MKKRYTKCECCPYYGKDFADNKWKCAREYIWSSGPYKCIFSYSDTAKECVEIIDRWINANKENANEGK